MARRVMKIALYGLIMISLGILGYVGYRQILPVVIPNENTPLAGFILGDWEVNQGTPPLITNVQFVDEKKLEYDVRTSDDGDHATGLYYQFISENTIQVQGGSRAFIDESWQLKRFGEKLEICFPRHPCGTFSREIPWQWMWICFAVIVLAIFQLKKIERKSLSDIHSA